MDFVNTNLSNHKLTTKILTWL